MAKIKCKLFGHPEITEDDKKIVLPEGKLSGLLYYLLINRVTNRDVVATLFWPNSNDQRAKTSLRNAIHKIRKCFKDDIILSPNKTIITLNEDLDIEIDVEIFEQDPLKNIEYYNGDFLKGLFVNDSEEFDYWITEQKEYYEELYRKALEEEISKNFNEGNFEELQKSANSLLLIDNYNETAYLHLIRYYYEIGRHDKVINEFHYYQNLMNEDLGLPLTGTIVNLYKKSKKQVEDNKESTAKKNNSMYLRKYEIDLIQKNIEDFKSNEPFKSILIKGEVGVGKTLLKKEALRNYLQDFTIFETQCISLEKDISFSPWIKIISAIETELDKKNIKRPRLWDDVLNKLFYSSKEYQPTVQILENKSDFNTDIIFKALISAFELLSTNTKIIIVIEDLQWADYLSIKLLSNFILQKNNKIMFVLTKSEENDDGYKLLSILKDFNKLQVIELNRFTRSEVFSIIKKSIGDKEITREEINDIYEKSKGNAFFLNEYIDLFINNSREIEIFPQIKNLLKDKFSILTENEIYILRIVSAFYEKASLDYLLKLINLEPFEILKCLNNLIKLEILEEEIDEDKSFVDFAYSAYKTYFYRGLNELSKRIIHNEIAQVLESSLSDGKSDIATLIKLENHFLKADEKIKSLKYKVHTLNYYLNFSHEMFPDMDDFDLSVQVKQYIKNDKALSMIDEVEKEILLVKNSSMNNEDKQIIMDTEILFLYCKGRYLIRGGNYSDGIHVMNRVIRLAKENNNIDIEILGRKQMIIYGIQINNPEIMLKHIIPGIKVAKKYNKILDMGVLNRLYGVYNLMIRDFQTAEEMFINSIDLYSDSAIIANSNSISIAANYNYIGEIRKSNFEYVEAMNYYKKAIELVEDIEASCLSIFYINAGITSFLMNDLDSMKSYFYKSNNIVKRFDTYWKKPVLNAFLALDYFIEENYKKSLEHIKDAISDAKTINNTRDIGYVYFVEAIISSNIKSEEIYNFFLNNGYYKESPEYYMYQAIKYLDEKRDRAEIEYLKTNIVK